MPNYLYNGIELPQLPEWDKSIYPYAVIVKQGYFTTYYKLRCYATISYYTDVDGERKFGGDGTVAIGYQVPVTDATNSAWESVGEIDVSTVVGEHSVSDDNSGNLMWANFDVLNTDGTIYLAASKPILLAEAYSSYLYNGTWQKGTFYKRVNNVWVKHQAYRRVNGAWVKVKE